MKRVVVPYLALVVTVVVGGRAAWLLWDGGATLATATGLLLSLAVVQPLVTGLLAARLGWSRSAGRAAAALSLAVPGVGLMMPMVASTPVAGPQRSIEPHPIAVAAAELPVDIDAVLADARWASSHSLLTAQPPAITWLHHGQPSERLAALATAAAVDQPVAWRAVASATADPNEEVRDRAVDCIEQRRAEYELELAALREVDDGGWSELVRRRDYALSELHSPRHRDRTLARAYRMARCRFEAADRSTQWQWSALAGRLALDRGCASDALAILERSVVPPASEPACAALRAEAMAMAGRWREARVLARRLRDDGHELPACLAALCRRPEPQGADLSASGGS